LLGGQVTIDLTTVTNGEISVMGVGEVVDQNGNQLASGTYGSLVIDNKTMNKYEIAGGVWGHVLEGLFTAQDIMKLLGASAAGKLTGADQGTLEITGLDGTTVRITVNTDTVGNRLTAAYNVS
jgi:hypothetical protein